MKTLHPRSQGPLQTGNRIPDLAPAEAAATALAAVRRRRTSKVVMVVHSAACPGCISYLATLLAREEQLREWDAVPVVLVPGDDPRLRELEDHLGSSAVVFADRAGRWHAAAGIDGAALLISDQWDELHVVEVAGPGHPLTSPREIEQWVRFLATKCPECEGEAL